MRFPENLQSRRFLKLSWSRENLTVNLAVFYDKLHETFHMSFKNVMFIHAKCIHNMADILPKMLIVSKQKIIDT